MKNISPAFVSTSDFFRAVFENSPDAAAITRLNDGIILYANRGFTRISGYSPGEAIGKTTVDLNLYYTPSDRDRIIDKLIITGRIDGENVMLVRKDGSTLFGILTGGVFACDGVDYVSFQLHDRSEQERIKREKEESEQNYRRLFETMTQGVVYQNASGQVISANPAAERMLGLSNEEMSKRTSLSPEWRTIREDGSPLPGKDHPSMIALRTGKLVGPQTLGVYNEQLGGYVWLSVVATPLFQPGEERPGQVYVIMQDITRERSAQRNYEQLFHEMVDGFALHEMIFNEAGKPYDYRYIAVNPAFERMTGLSGSELVGNTVLEMLPGTEQYWIDIYGKVVLSGDPVTFQNYSAALDKFFSVTAYRPAPGQFACTFSDVTERIRLEQEALKAEEQISRLAHISDIAPSSITVCTYSGKLLYANEYACRMHGYEKAAFMQLNLGKLIADASPELGARRLQQILEHGENTFEASHYVNGGGVIPLLIYSKRIDWDGAPAILSIGTDLTERLKAEHNLQTSLEQNRRILNHLQDGYFQADLDGTYRMLNPRAAELYGFAGIDEMMRSRMQQMYARAEDHTELLQKLLQDGSITNHVCLAKKQDGSTFWVSMHVQYLKSETGETVGIEGLIRDISERKQLEEEIARQRDSLKESNEVLSRRLQQSINALSKMGELRDVYTAGHQRRVQQLACEIAAHYGMTQEAITNLSYGALIHDIGKIYIASDILNKPGKITNLEYQILQTHAEYGYNILREIDLPQQILTMILQHHERLDGSGYPGGLSGDQIILESRILAVADVVEAMTSHRPYRPALGIDAALNEIEQHKGKYFDPDVVDICVSLFRQHGFTFSES